MQHRTIRKNQEKSGKNMAARLPCLLLVMVMVFCARGALAGNNAINLIEQPKPDVIALAPVYATVQAVTELDAFSRPPAADGISTGDYRAGLPRFSIATNNFFSNRITLNDFSLGYAFTPNLSAQVNLPIVTSRITLGGASDTNTGVGDTSVTVKYRDLFGESTEIFYLLTAKLPSGDEGTGAGTGSYDFSYTQKLSTWFGNYRTTLMAGVTIPTPSDTHILGSQVQYGPTISYMAAAERSFFLPRLWFGLRATGRHSFGARIDSAYQPNSLTTLDIIPEVSYFTSGALGFHLGVIVPTFTSYTLPGGTNHRNPIINFGLSKAF